MFAAPAQSMRAGLVFEAQQRYVTFVRVSNITRRVTKLTYIYGTIGLLRQKPWSPCPHCRWSHGVRSPPASQNHEA